MLMQLTRPAFSSDGVIFLSSQFYDLIYNSLFNTFQLSTVTF